MAHAEPEVIQCPGPTANTPNSHLPILVYRSVPEVLRASPEKQQDLIDAAKQNGWYYGGTFKTFPTAHYHTVTHEAYAVISGSATTSLGVGPLDDADHGVVVELRKGDIILQPAGVAHATLGSEDTYEYIGLYPDGSPAYDNNYCNDPFPDTQRKKDVARKVPVPASDPVHGPNGPLVRLWRDHDDEYWDNVRRVNIAASVLCG